jgi:hypothetical protein
MAYETRETLADETEISNGAALADLPDGRRRLISARSIRRERASEPKAAPR